MADRYLDACRVVGEMHSRTLHKVTLWCNGETSDGEEPWVGIELPAELFELITRDNGPALETMLVDFRARVLELLRGK